MCPLLFSVFGLPVFQALFVSVMLDVTNGLTLTIIYGLHGKVDFRYGVTFGVVALAWAVLLSIVLSDWIEVNEDKLKKAVSFVPLLIALQFLIRGLLAWRRKRRETAEAEAAAAAAEADAAANGTADPEAEADAEAAAAAAETPETPLTATSSHPPAPRSRAGSLTTPRSRAGSLTGDRHFPVLISRRDSMVTTPIEIGSRIVVVSGGLKDVEPGTHVPTDEEAAAAELEGNKLSLAVAGGSAHSYSSIGGNHVAPVSSLNGESSKDDITETAKAAGLRVIGFLRTKFRPDEDIIAQQTGNRGWRIGVTVLIHSILGIVSGVLYAGGGMFFANVIVNFWTARVRTAAGTGCFIMTVVMASMSFTFIGRTDMDNIVNLYHLLLSLPFGIIGAVLGAKLALRISDLLMYFVIVGVSLVLFAVILINGTLAGDETTPSPAWI